MKPYKGGRAGRGKGKKGKKSGGRVVDAFGSDGDAPSKDRRSSRPSKNKPTRQERSSLGFVVAAAVAVGGIAVAILSNVKSRKESDRVLRSMRKKPLAITDHAACRYVWQVCQHFSGTSRPRVGSGPVTHSLTRSLAHSLKPSLPHTQDGLPICVEERRVGELVQRARQSAKERPRGEAWQLRQGCRRCNDIKGKRADEECTERVCGMRGRDAASDRHRHVDQLAVWAVLRLQNVTTGPSGTSRRCWHPAVPGTRCDGVRRRMEVRGGRCVAGRAVL